MISSDANRALPSIHQHRFYHSHLNRMCAIERDLLEYRYKIKTTMARSDDSQEILSFQIIRPLASHSVRIVEIIRNSYKEQIL